VQDLSKNVCSFTLKSNLVTETQCSRCQCSCIVSVHVLSVFMYCQCSCIVSKMQQKNKIYKHLIFFFKRGTIQMSRKHNNKNQNFIRERVRQYRSDSGNAWYIQFRIFLPCLLSKISEYVFTLYCVV